jgi:hypothetical protein
LLYGADLAPGDAHALASRQYRRHPGAGVAVTWIRDLMVNALLILH